MSSTAHSENPLPKNRAAELSSSITPLVSHAANSMSAMSHLPDSTSTLQNQQVLASAFEQFNAVSAQLADTYHEMERRVGSLNQELHELAEQRLAELKEKERVSQRLESLLNLMPAGVVVLDNKGVVVQCNPAALEFLGEPLEGELWRDVIRRSFAPQRDDGHEISLKDGRRVNMVTRSFQGSDPGQLILLTDLTETRELQKRLDRHRRLSEMGRMMSSLAHQIRTPLSAAMLYTGHLCDSDLTQDQQQRFSEKVLSRLNHLDQQVKDMLIFVKGDVKLTDSIRVSELLGEFEAALEAPINSSQSSYQIIVECPEMMLHCNRESMVGAMMNLANNAIQSVGKNIELSICVSCVNDQNIELVVSDNGPGISPQVMKNLQDPFFTTKSQGTGLGLSVVRAVVQAHHGEFQIQSQVGVGTRAILLLPVMNTVMDSVVDNGGSASNLRSVS